MYGFISVDVDQENGAVETNPEASFVRFNDTRISDIFVAAVTGVLEGGDSDICFVGDNAEILLVEDAPELLVGDPEIGEFLSAGETLTFTSSVGTYATLERQTQSSPIDGSTLIFYELPDGALAGEPLRSIVFYGLYKADSIREALILIFLRCDFQHIRVNRLISG